MDTHPLKTWLDRKRMAIFAFSRASGLPFRQLYDLLRLGSKVDPKVSTLLKIEEGTGGKVTAEKQIKYFRGRNGTQEKD